MTTTADKLDREILKHLRGVNGAQDASIGQWLNVLQERSGEWADYAEVESAMKRLRADGIVRLMKYHPELNRLYEYHGNEGDAFDRWFFGFASFEVRITDQGRRYWNVPRGKIGFQQSA
jgi:hypothetical protein